jgi:hypothetical protein
MKNYSSIYKTYLNLTKLNISVVLRNILCRIDYLVYGSNHNIYPPGDEGDNLKFLTSLAECNSLRSDDIYKLAARVVLVHKNIHKTDLSPRTMIEIWLTLVYKSSACGSITYPRSPLDRHNILYCEGPFYYSYFFSTVALLRDYMNPSRMDIKFNVRNSNGEERELNSLEILDRYILNFHKRKRSVDYYGLINSINEIYSTPEAILKTLKDELIQKVNKL